QSRHYGREAQGQVTRRRATPHFSAAPERDLQSGAGAVPPESGALSHGDDSSPGAGHSSAAHGTNGQRHYRAPGRAVGPSAALAGHALPRLLLQGPQELETGATQF